MVNLGIAPQVYINKLWKQHLSLPFTIYSLPFLLPCSRSVSRRSQSKDGNS